IFRLNRFKRYPYGPVISALGIRVVLAMRAPRYRCDRHQDTACTESVTVTGLRSPIRLVLQVPVDHIASRATIGWGAVACAARATPSPASEPNGALSERRGVPRSCWTGRCGRRSLPPGRG